jgi:uncharacterized protein
MIEPPFRQAIADYLRENAKPVEKWSHQPRLYELACALAETQSFDDDVLYAAAYLHDIGVFIGHRPEDPVALAKWDNLAYAVEKVPALLQQFGFPASKIPAVIDVIRSHLPSGVPTTFEGILLRDADILEQLGSVGILRIVSKVGRDTRFLRFTDATKTLRRNVEQLPGQLKLASAKRIAVERVTVLRLFLAAAEREACGIDL